MIKKCPMVSCNGKMELIDKIGRKLRYKCKKCGCLESIIEEKEEIKEI